MTRKLKPDEAKCAICGCIKKMYLMVVKEGQWTCADCDPDCHPVNDKEQS